MPHLEIAEVVLVHCNIVNRDYQLHSRVLYIFVPSKSVGQLSGVSPQSFLIQSFRILDYWFNDHHSKLQEIEVNINITLVINWCVTYKKWSVIKLNLEIIYL